jgi:hypothetical protein
MRILICTETNVKDEINQFTKGEYDTTIMWNQNKG